MLKVYNIASEDYSIVSEMGDIIDKRGFWTYPNVIESHWRDTISECGLLWL